MFTTDQLRDLTDDGDETTNPQGFTLRLSIEPDDLYYNDIEDPEVFGEVVPCERIYGRDAERPPHFNGAARKLHPNGYCNRYSAYWWQPPTGDYAPTDVQAFARYVTEILADGYAYVSLTLTTPDGSTFTDGLGGISPAYPTAEDLSYILPDILSETLHQFYASAAATLHTSPDILTY